MGISVRLGRSGKSPQTGWLMKSRNVLLAVLEPGSLGRGCQHGPVRSLFLAAHLFWCPHVAERVGVLRSAKALGAGTDPIHAGSPFMIYTPPKGSIS